MAPPVGWGYTGMKKIEYPILYFRLQEECFLGLLVGTEYQVIEKSAQKVKSVLTERLQKAYKRDGEYPDMEIQNPMMKMIDLPVRPCLRKGNATYPLAKTLRIETPLVYGMEEEEVYDCYLPLLDANFYCYDPGQLDTLARHFLKSLFDEMSPTELFRHLLYPHPQLDTVVMRVKEETEYDFNFPPCKPRLLERLADRYPYPKSVRRSLNPLPDAAWELDSYILRATDIIVKQKASLLVCGHPGTGKTAVIKAAFKKIAAFGKKSTPSYSFWRIRAQRITATSKYLGEWQEVVESIIAELQNEKGILWVEDVVELLRQGSLSVQNSVAAYMLPFIQTGKLQLVGEVTPQELESLRRFLPGFAESVQVLEIPELPPARINIIFKKFSDAVGQTLRIAIKKEAVEASLQLLKRFYPYESFPGKGIRFLGECIGEAQLNNKARITKHQVIQQFIRRSGLPELFLRDDLLLDQQELTAFFNQRIIGQQEANRQLCDIIKVFKAGLNNPHRPIATLIFAGPTGVGKTASARALADYFFGKGQKQTPLIRIDMSEFNHPSRITRFIGEGRQPGKFVSEVRNKPFAVLLLDEAEKADPSIFDAFLSMLDEGVLVDAFGRVTSFRNCIIVLTTNLGASNQRSIGFGSSTPNQATWLGAIGRFFRPEFLNRIDNIVIFNPLTKEDIRQITLKELEEVKRREGFLKKGLRIVFDSSITDFLASVGFDEKYGARPLQRAIEDHIVRPLAKWLLQNPGVQNQEVVVAHKEKIVIQ